MPIRHGGLLQIPLDRGGRRRSRDESTLRHHALTHARASPFRSKRSSGRGWREGIAESNRGGGNFVGFWKVDRDS